MPLTLIFVSVVFVGFSIALCIIATNSTGGDFKQQGREEGLTWSKGLLLESSRGHS